jgi:hypothetical protein
MANSTSRSAYRRRVWQRARADWRDFKRQKSLATNAITGVITTALAVYVGRRMSGSGFSVGVGLISGFVGALGGWAIVWIASLLYFRWQAPYQLDQERKEDIEEERSAGRIAITEAKNAIAILEKPKTLLDVTAERQSGNVYLIVHNLSGIAWVWATIEYIAGLIADWPAHDVFAKWNHQATVRTQIPKEGRARLFVGRLHGDHGPSPGGIWFVPFASEQEPPGEAKATYHFSYGMDRRDTVMLSAIELCVTIYSDPELDFPIRKYVLLAGGWSEVHDQPILGSGSEPWLLEQTRLQPQTKPE